MMSRTDIDITTINAAIRTGGQEYWRTIYHAFFGPLQVFITSEFRIPGDVAENLSCKTLLKLVNGAKKPAFGHPHQFVAWLYKAARTTAIDYWNSLEGKTQRESDCSELAIDLAVEVPDVVGADFAPDAVVERVMAGLTDAERMILTMRANGTPYSLIAEELGIGENAARTGFGRAKKKFVRLYQPVDGASDNTVTSSEAINVGRLPIAA